MRIYPLTYLQIYRQICMQMYLQTYLYIYADISTDLFCASVRPCHICPTFLTGTWPCMSMYNIHIHIYTYIIYVYIYTYTCVCMLEITRSLSQTLRDHQNPSVITRGSPGDPGFGTDKSWLSTRHNLC